MHARALCSHLWEEKSLPSCFYITKNGMIACAINTKAPALLSLYKIRAINGCEDNLNIYRDYWGIQSFTSNTSLRLFAQIGRHLSLMEVLLFFWKTNKITTRVTTWLTPARCYSSLCRSCWPFPSCTDFSNSKWQGLLLSQILNFLLGPKFHAWSSDLRPQSQCLGIVTLSLC